MLRVSSIEEEKVLRAAFIEEKKIEVVFHLQKV
jgi:hypothetical protein